MVNANYYHFPQGRSETYPRYDGSTELPRKTFCGHRLSILLDIAAPEELETAAVWRLSLLFVITFCMLVLLNSFVQSHNCMTESANKAADSDISLILGIHVVSGRNVLVGCA